MCYYLNVQFQGQRVNITPVSSQPVGLGTGVEGPWILNKGTAKPYSHQTEAGFVNRPEDKTFIVSAKFAISNSRKTAPIISLKEKSIKK